LTKALVNFANAFINFANKLSTITGIAAAAAVALAMLVVFLDVFSRIILGITLFWAHDVSYMLGGTAILMGAAYTLMNNKHVRVDIFYGKLSKKGQAILDIALGLLLFFPLMITGSYNASKMAIFSISALERTMSGYWQPPIYHVKTLLALAIIILIIQGLAKLIQDAAKIKGG